MWQCVPLSVNDYAEFFAIDLRLLFFFTYSNFPKAAVISWKNHIITIKLR